MQLGPGGEGTRSDRREVFVIREEEKKDDLKDAQED